MAIDAGKVLAILELDTGKFSGPIKQAQSAIVELGNSSEKVSSRIKGLGGAMQSAGSALSKGVTLPLVAAGTASVKFATDLDTSSRKVMTIADSAYMSLDSVKSGIKAMAPELGASTAGLNEGLYGMISATGDTKNAMEYLEIASKGAVAGFTNQAIAVDGLTTVMNAYGMRGGNAMRAVSDQMLIAQNYGKTTFGELAASIGNVIPLSATLKISTTELFAALAALTKQGIGTSEAVTGLKAAFSGIIKPTSEASKMAKKLGLDFSMSAIESKGLAGFLDDVIQKTGGSTEKMSQLFGSVEALNTILGLTGQAGRIEFAGALSAMGESAGATEKAFATMTGGVEWSAKRVRAQIENIGSTMGAILLPSVEQGLSGIGKVLDAFQKLSPATQSAIVSAAGYAAALGPVLLISGKLVTASAALGTFISGPAGWITLGVLGAGALAIALASVSDAADSADAAMDRAFKKIDPKSLAGMQKGYDSQVTVDAEVTTKAHYAEGAKSLYETIYNLLTDGKPDTKAQGDDLNKRANEYYDELIGQVNIQESEKLAGIKESFEKGFIDPAEYEKKVAEIQKSSEGMRTELEGLREGALSYIQTMSGAPTATVQAAYDQISELERRTAALGAELDKINQKATEMARIAAEQVKAGVPVSEERVGEAFGVTQDDYNAELARIEQWAKEYQDAIDKAWSESGADDTNRDQTKKDKDADLQKQVAAQRQAAEQAYQAEMNALFQGLIAQEPALQAQLNGILEKFNLQEMINQAITESGTDEGLSPALADKLKAAFGEDEDYEIAGPELKWWQDRVKTEIDNAVRDLDLSGSVTAKAMEVVKDKLPESLDLSDAQTKIQAMLGQLEFFVTVTPEIQGPPKPETQGPPEKTPPSGNRMDRELERRGGASQPATVTVTPEVAEPLAADELVEGADDAGAVEIPVKLDLDDDSGASDSAQPGGVKQIIPLDFEIADTNVVGPAIEAIEGAQSEAQSAAEGVADAAADGLDSQQAAARAAGENMIGGMISGANSKGGLLVSTMTTLAQRAIQAARSALQINSPSKVFVGIGSSVVEGFAMGIDKNLSASQGAMKRVLDTANIPGPTSGGKGGAVPPINLTLPGATIRSEDDARAVSKHLAKYVNRLNAGRGY